MTKKEYLLKVLEKIQDERAVARGLKVLVQHGNLNQETLDAMVSIFTDALQYVTDESKRAKLEKTLDIVNQIKDREAQARKKDQEDLSHLDDMIANL